jgi:DHA1 family inner membrane transport protein
MSEQTLSRQRERIHPPMGLFPAMLALGAGGLCIGTGEFAPMSLLPDLAPGTGVSIPAGEATSAPMRAWWSVPRQSRCLARQARKTPAADTVNYCACRLCPERTGYGL